jgi:hypothetical protein
MSLSFRKTALVCVCILADTSVLSLRQSKPSYRHTAIYTSGLNVPVKCIQLTKRHSSATFFKAYVME